MENSRVDSGFDVRNIESLDDKYRCPVCTFILKDAVQLDCGHRICKLCVPREDNIFQCPKCSETTLATQIKLDKAFNREIQSLHINCNICNWSGLLKTYENHLQESHNQYKCSYCNQTYDSAVLLNQHIETACPQMPVNCILQEYGCNEKILRRNLPEHYLSEIHQRILLLLILQLIAMITEQDKKLVVYDGQIAQPKIDHVYNMATTTTTTMSDLITDEYKVEEGYLKKTIDTLSSGIQVLKDDLHRLSDESLQQSQTVETIDQNATILKTSCEESNAALNALNTNLTILQQDSSSLKQKFEESQITSYDGTLIWRIPNVQQKMMDAQSERQVSIYSPPFFSSPTGYKMRARLYLFGDGNARRTHFSLFFVLMRSVNDSLLKFPFNYKVTFSLIDQSGQQNHIIDSFRPDPRSNSFQRPQCDMNIASGIPKFVQLSTIEQPDNPYIKDDTMFIRVMVDFESLPKAMLSYAMSLNPGIPTHCQQKMIQQEMERRAQVRPNESGTKNKK